MDILFLIVSLLILCFITGMKMLIQIWGKKYRYTTAWNLVETEKNKERIKHKRRYQR
ncbi:hypothetical protein [Metabacillus halosaccharovorans]|uniref:hypothetical protein n=1 Tax=Metabacillus halosaccharovorans TaxID=930124 RepID=UPI001473C108|nr:hypothetical protein [Metabacillus halosaccharovorans]